ncbi:MAG: 23S rRNA (uracil(1939)-C(5))-methyltransferase RlmD [Eubacteriaceae bacterium]|jgi:23S rRNA (uracil1939-C5)-methyltransferase
MLKKNDTIDITIEDMTATGEGVGKHEGMTVFVDGAVPGDEVSARIGVVKPRYAKAEIKEVIQPSSKRKSDGFVCPNAAVCGGCPFFDVDYAEQLRLKEKQVRDALQRIGGFEDPQVLPVIGMENPYHYRNKAQYKVCSKGLGFYQKGSHQVVPIGSCLTQPENSERIISILNSIIKKNGLTVYNEQTHKGLLRGIIQRTNRKGETMLVFVINGRRLPNEQEIISKLSRDKDIVSVYININREKGNRILGKESRLIYGQEYLTETLGGKQFKLSPSSFFQVNTEQTEVLYGLVRDYANVQPGEALYDLYCGTGTIGIYVADGDTRLTGIEINPEAVADAQENAALNGLTNAEFLAGKAEVIAPELSGKPDCIILDPPRKGCDESLLKLLLELKAPRIVYVSCNPTTLARDLKILAPDYKAEKIQPVDLFPQTGHVETVVLMSRVEGK